VTDRAQPSTNRILGVAKQRLAEPSAALRATVSLLTAILESSPDGIVAMDGNGRIIANNAKMSGIWSIPAVDFSNGCYADLVVRAASVMRNPIEFRRTSDTLLTNTTDESFDLVELIDGRTFERRTVRQLIDGDSTGTVVFWRDVTERKRSADAQLALADQLRQSQKMDSLGALAGGIAHDFNNILGVILGNVEIAITTVEADHPLVESLSAIQRAGDRATQLVQQILTFSRQQRHVLEEVMLGESVREAVGLLRATIPAGIEIITTCDSTAPHILADPTQVHQLVMNLCTNAMHALKERPGGVGRAGRITLRVEHGVTGFGLGLDAPSTLAPGPFVRLAVIDDGIGMDAATKGRIFDPFFTTRQLGEGTGLGLSVVHGIMDVHHGAIAVESTLGTGSGFFLYFPAHYPAHATTASSRDHRAVRSAPPTLTALTGEGRQIMYVDDEPMIVSLVTRLLSKAGFEVTGFTRSSLAVEAFTANPQFFDVIITDFNMPELSGLELAQSALARRPDVPIVVTSGYISTELQREMERLGLVHLLYKPDLAKRLLPTIRALALGPIPDRS